jgi:hypothetical protein
MDEYWYKTAIEEYRSLRSEAVKTREAALSTLQLGVALVAALVGLGVTLRSEKFLGAGLLSVVVPVMVGFTFELWIGEIRRSVRAGAIVAAIEQRFAQYFKDDPLGPPMGWETWLRRPASNGGYPVTKGRSQQEHDSLVLALAISAFLFVVAAGSCVLGLHFMWHAKYDGATEVVGIAMGVGLILLVVRAGFAVHGIRLRDNPPRPRDVWRFEEHPAQTAGANAGG